MTKKELLAKIAALGSITKEQRNDIVCSLVGHSRIITSFFGYVNCARCDGQIGDALGGCYDTTDKVIVGHNCPVCRENYEKLTWKDKLYTPDPFKETRP